MKILLIEDDLRLAQLIVRQLQREQHSADVAHDGEMGLELALRGDYDALIVDWMLPKRDGPSICHAVRAARLTLPILMLTARGELEDRVSGLDSGADDYLTKPFALQELLARVRAMSRRVAGAHGHADELHCGDLMMDLRSHTVHRNMVSLALTMTEWNLLEYLMRHQGQALTRQQILDAVWSYDRDVQPKMVDIYISYLRRALNANGQADLIQAVRGIGYRLVEGTASVSMPKTQDIDV